MYNSHEINVRMSLSWRDFAILNGYASYMTLVEISEYKRSKSPEEWTFADALGVAIKRGIDELREELNW